MRRSSYSRRLSRIAFGSGFRCSDAVGVRAGLVAGDAQRRQGVGVPQALAAGADARHDDVAVQALLLVDLAALVDLVVGVEGGEVLPLVAARAELLDGVVGPAAQEAGVLAADRAQALGGLVAADADDRLLLEGRVREIHLPGRGGGLDPQRMVLDARVAALAEPQGFPGEAQHDRRARLRRVGVTGEAEDLAAVGIQVHRVGEDLREIVAQRGEEQRAAVDPVAVQAGRAGRRDVAAGIVGAIDPRVAGAAEAPPPPGR